MKRIILIIAVIFSRTLCLSQTPIKVSAEVIKAFIETQGAYDDFDKMRNVIKEIESGKSPSVPSYGSNWNPLINNYLIAANDIKTAPLPTDFDAKAYTISFDEIMNCTFKESNFQKLRAYKKEMDMAVIRGNNYLDTLSKFKSYLDRTDEALRYLIEVNAKLASVPIYSQIFQWNWFDLETAVRPALNTLSNAVREQDKKLRIEMKSISTQKSNLEANINSLETSICIFDGIFQNNCHNDDVMITLKLNIRRFGAIYSGTLTMTSNGVVKTINSTSVTLTNSKIVNFTGDIGGGIVRTWTGELSKDYKTIYRFKQNDLLVCDLKKQ